MIYLDWNGESGDPYWGNVIFLMHADDTPGTTLPVDSSSFAQTTWVGVPGLQTTAIQSKFGGGSLTSIDAPNYAGLIAFLPGSEGNADEWTIEFWLRPLSIGNYNFGFVFSNGNGIILLAGPLDSAFSGRILCVNSLSASMASTTTIALNDWTHVAVSRAFTSVGVYTSRLFINGVKEDESASGLPPLNNSSSWRIGQTDSAGFSALRGYLDDFRITAGVARYTADFTPPAKAFPNGY